MYKTTNQKLSDVYYLLMQYKGNPKYARAILKINNKLAPVFEEYRSELIKIADDFFVKDEHGEFVTLENGENVIQEGKVFSEYKKLAEELNNEPAYVDFSTVSPYLSTTKEALESWDTELNQAEIQALDDFLDYLDEKEE